MEKFRVGIIGATGMVGQRFVLLTANHPWFTPVVLAASAHSAGKTYAQAIEGKWHMAEPIPESVKFKFEKAVLEIISPFILICSR